MTEKTKDTFNLSDKTEYKYNFISSTASVNVLDKLNSLNINGTLSLNGLIDEYYFVIQRLGKNRDNTSRILYKLHFTRTDE